MSRHLRVLGGVVRGRRSCSARPRSSPILGPPTPGRVEADARQRHGLNAGAARRPAGGVTAQAVVPAGFTDQQTLTGLTAPTVIQFAPDGRVFVAEKRGIIKVFDSLSDTTPDDVRRPPAPGRRLLGPRPARHGAAPELPDQPLRLRPVHVRRPDRRHGPGVERRLPDAARPDDGRVRGQRPAVAPARRRATSARGPSRCSSTTGASSSRATRSARSRSGPTARCTSAAATARASTSPTTARPAAAARTRPPR